jgi:flavodoxin-like protein
MNVLIVFESMYGNTRAIADAIAAGFREGGADVAVHHLSEIPPDAGGADLLVVGGPTHMHGLSSKLSRKMAAEAAHEDNHEMDPQATDGEGLRGWLAALAHADGGRAAAFDTRGDAKAALTGSAARGIARRLRHHGFEVTGRESFLVDDSEGPLADGELDRAHAWGAELAAAVTSGARL